MPATPETVFEALVDEAARTIWLPPAGMTGRFEHFDPRPGGSYRLILTYEDPDQVGKSGSNTDVVEARFATIQPPHRIVEQSDFESDDPSLVGTMTIIWTVDRDSAGSRVTVTAIDVPDGVSAADHEAGLSSSLANLARYVTP